MFQAVVRKCLKLKKITDSVITTHYHSKITESVYGNCYGIVALENRGHSLKVFALMSSQVTTYFCVMESINGGEVIHFLLLC